MATSKGGDKVKAKLRLLANNMANAKTVRVGFLENATYPDGTPVPMVAAIQNYGAPRAGIPPRPFFTTMVKTKSKEWGAAAAGLMKQTNYDAQKTLALMGEGISGQLRQSIVDTNAPALSPVTLMLRKMQYDDPKLVVTGKTVGEARAKVAAGESYAGAPTKPLVWTGHLLNSIDYEVKK